MKNTTESAEALIETNEVVEVDALSKAIDTLAKAMKESKDEESKDEESKDEESKDEESDDVEKALAKDDESEDDESEDDESEDEDLEKARTADFERALKAMASGTDEIVSDFEKRIGAVMKGVSAMLEEMKSLRAEQGAMAKSLNAVAAQPVAPRAVTSASVAPVVVAPVVERGEMIRKALTKLQSADTDAPTRYRLRGAIAQLESGAPLSHDLTSLIG
jgi:hypothetical protein